MSLSTMSSTLRLSPTTALRPRAACLQQRSGRTRLRISAETIWELRPEAKWRTKNEQKAKKLGDVFNLSDSIGAKEEAFVKSSGGDFTIPGLEHLGLNLQFKSSHTDPSVDSPNDLLITDKGSDVPVTLNGEQLQKDKEYSLGPGSVLGFGDEALYQVERDTRAHA